MNEILVGKWTEGGGGGREGRGGEGREGREGGEGGRGGEGGEGAVEGLTSWSTNRVLEVFATRPVLGREVRCLSADCASETTLPVKSRS